MKVNIEGEKSPQEKMLKNKIKIHRKKSLPNANNSLRSGSRSKKWSQNIYSDILEIDEDSIPKLSETEEAVGIITMEDVIEELLQVIMVIYFEQFQLTPMNEILY